MEVSIARGGGGGVTRLNFTGSKGFFSLDGILGEFSLDEKFLSLDRKRVKRLKNLT